MRAVHISEAVVLEERDWAREGKENMRVRRVLEKEQAEKAEE